MKNDRKKAILDIVSHYEVDTQETLQALLLERGFSVTQATVSRDIKQLSLVKTMSESGSYKYSLPRGEYDGGSRSGLMRFFADAVYAVDRGMNTVVIHCHSGMANAVCARLDNAGYGDIVGTLAGDDTIFVLMRTEDDAVKMLRELEKLI